MRDSSIGSSKQPSKAAHGRPSRPSGARSMRNGVLQAAYAATYPWSKIGKEEQLSRAEPPPGRGGTPDEPTMLHRGTPWGPAGFGALVIYFFATWSPLVHNLGALDWLVFLFSL